VTYSASEIPANGTSLISATATDARGNLSIAGSRSVRVDRIAPGQPLLNTVAGAGKVSMDDVTKGVWPFMLVQFALMFLMVLFPEIVMVPARWLIGN
jgi:hypothetical protein